MSYLPIKVSKPVDKIEDVSPSEVFEFSPNHMRLDAKEDEKKSVIFLKRGWIDGWKSEWQRNKIFQAISGSEASLKDRTIVTILEVNEDSCKYSYRANGQIIRKSIALAPDEEIFQDEEVEEVFQEIDDDVFQSLGPDPDQIPSVSPQNAQCYYKVSELSLRQFKQIELSHAVIEGLKAVLEFLATPFIALYRLMAGIEAREFAKMLNPVQHDRVGELTHDDVLNQMRFVGDFFTQSDPIQHGSGTNTTIIKRERLVQSYYMEKDLPVREKTDKNGKTYYEFYTLEAENYIPFFPTNPQYSIQGKQVLFKGKLYDYHFVLKGDRQGEAWTLGHTYNEVISKKSRDDYSFRTRQVKDSTKPKGHPDRKKTIYEIKVGSDWKEVQYEIKVPGWKPVPLNENEVFYKGAVRLFRKRWENDVTRVCEIEVDGEWKKVQQNLDGDGDYHLNFYKITEHGETHHLEVIQHRYYTYLSEKEKIEDNHVKRWEAPKVESDVQKAGSIFQRGYEMGKAIHEARNQDNDRAIQGISVNLSEQLANIEEEKVMVLPLAQGEGGDYLPHFLMFVDVPVVYEKPFKGQKYGWKGLLDTPLIKTPRKVLMKHICFSSTSLDKGKREAIATYDVTEIFADPTKMIPFFRALIGNQPYVRKRDALLVNTQGPMLRDNSLSQLLLTVGKPVVQAGDKHVPLTKASRDPVKALFTIAHELNLQSSHTKNKLSEITASKAKFYKFYVDHLTVYYEENEEKLTGAQRARALEGILHYANKVQDYMEQELRLDTGHGVDAALAITEHFLAFVEKKLSELKRTEALEKQDLEKLQSSVQVFWAKISEPIDQTLKFKKTASNLIEESRVSIADSLATEELRIQLAINNLDTDGRTKAFAIFNQLIQKAKDALRADNPKAAKTLLVKVMQSLPVPDGLDKLTFWTKITPQEIPLWSKALSALTASLFEAVIRTGKYPLPPHEVFEFHTVIPLIQRVLFERIIPVKMAAFNADWNAKAPAKVAELIKRTDEFIIMREGQIVKDVTEELKKEWDEEDKRDAAIMNAYYADVAAYPIKYASYLLEDARLRGAPPRWPDMPKLQDAKLKKLDRDARLASRIAAAKAADEFLNQLKGVKLELQTTNNLNFDGWFVGSSARLVAVLGCFVKILDVSCELLSYKVGGLGWIHQTLAFRDEDLWLLKKDLSIVPGSSPDFEKRYELCQRTLQAITATPFAGSGTGCSLVIGYEGLGDGTMLEPGLMQMLNSPESEVGNYQAGFFNEGKGASRFVPEEVARCCKDIEMRKILHSPEDYLGYHTSGLISFMQNKFGSDLTPNILRQKFSEMSAVYLVASKDSFTLSTSQKSPGNIGTNGMLEMVPTHDKRSHYLGQASVPMCERTVGGDQEPQAYSVSFNEHIFPDTDVVEDFILSVSALTKSANPEELSYLAIPQCLHFIYQYSEKLIIPQVQHTLYKTLFQHDLIRTMLQKNPTFFTTQGALLNQICLFLEKNTDHQKSGLFLRELCERIRRQAKALHLERVISQDAFDQISQALPEYSAARVIDIAVKKMEEKEQKEYAQYILAYYCHLNDDGINSSNPNQFPSPRDTMAWNRVLTAFYMMQKSKREIGHFGWQDELLKLVETRLLPKIADAINKDSTLRNELLDLLDTRIKSSTAENISWKRVKAQDYVYCISRGNETLIIDIRTGKNCSAEPKNTERCKLPECILSNPDFKFLFNAWNPDAGWTPKDKWNPTVLCEPSQNGKVVEYRWSNETETSSFIFRHRLADSSVQILQVVGNKTYRFQQLQISQGVGNIILKILARSSNQTVEDMVASKGIWIPEDDNPETTHALVAQYGCSIEEDPITLKIVDDNILEATLGEGDDKMWICSSLSDKASPLICREGYGLLLLSRDKNHIDEIRFPQDKGPPDDPNRQEQLILTKSSQDSNRWVFKNREDWEWKLTDTHAYEKRFGKNWREYILPLKNCKTGEEEFWIFPHFLTGSEKRGGGVKFSRTIMDIIESGGGKAFDQFKPSDLPEFIDLDAFKAIIGALESKGGEITTALEIFEMLMANVKPIAKFFKFDLNTGEANKFLKFIEEMMPLFKEILTTRGIKYSSNSCTHAGYFYLAYVASKNGDWATAGYYMDQMRDCGKSNSAEDIEQFQKMVLFLLGGEAAMIDFKSVLNKDFKSLLNTQSPMEAAFRAKLAARILFLNTSLKAQHKNGLLDIAKKIPDKFLQAVSPEIKKAIEAGGAEGLALVIKTGGAHFYQQYRNGLAAHHQELVEHGMLLTKEEEAILTNDITALLGSSAGGAFLNMQPTGNQTNIQPYNLAIPNKWEIDEMIKTMSNLNSSTGVWSIHSLHQDVGSYPKWENVLAHFWDYWDWIYRKEKTLSDISFLFREIPANAVHRNEVDTARRLLLILWNHCKGSSFKELRKQHAVEFETLLNKIQRTRLEMTDLGAMKLKSQDLRKEAAVNPSLLTSFRAAIAEYYYWGWRWLSGLTYKENVGGTTRERSPRSAFIQLSTNLLCEQLLKTTTGMDREGKMLTLEGITASPVHHNPAPIPQDDPKKIHRIKAVDDFFVVLKSIGEDVLDNEIKAQLAAVFDLPLEIASEKIIKLFELMSTFEGAEEHAAKIKVIKELIPSHFARIHRDYTKNVGNPTSPYPKKIEGGAYEPVQIFLPHQRPSWGSYFVSSCESWDMETGQWEKRDSIWKERAEEAKKEFDPARIKDDEENATRKKAKFTNVCAGIDKAVINLEMRTGSSFHVAKLKQMNQEISARLEGLRADEKKGFDAVLHFARAHGNELGLLHLFADRSRFTRKQIFDSILYLYRDGQLGCLENQALQIYFAQLITETLLIATERQQHEKALGACRDLSSVIRKIVAPKGVDAATRQNMIQNLANRTPDWIMYSADLKRFLEEGSNRLRYASTQEGAHFLRDQAFTRRYLVSDYFNGWTTREAASIALEQMMNDLHTVKNEKGEPVRFIRAKMGTGKSAFVFPEARNMLLQRGRQPMMITTDDLVPQLHVSMGQKDFVFKFDIDFGLEEKKDGKEHTPTEIETHLRAVLETLQNLKSEGKALLTSPSQIGGLRDKRVHLQEAMRLCPPSSERSILFKQLQLVKQIEAYFKSKNAVYLVDEDINFDISYEYNFASGEARTVDPIRFDAAELVIYTIQSKHKALWNKIVENDLRSIQNVAQEFEGVVRSIYHEDQFWARVGWKNWKEINEDAFVKFIFNKEKDPPKGMEWDHNQSALNQPEKCFVAALKTYLAEFRGTLEVAVKDVNPRQERGLSSQNNVTVVPFGADGLERKDVHYGNECELILHHVFHYLGAGNRLGEDVFNEKEKVLAGLLDQYISPHHDETWSDWQKAINDGLARYQQEKPENAHATRFEAFKNSQELALQRFQFLRYMMLQNNVVPVYIEQIAFNSQDLGIGTDIRVGSGTGQPFALNLAKYIVDNPDGNPANSTQATDPDEVLGETLLCLDLTKETITFSGSPLEFIQECARDKRCHAVLNYDYEVLQNDSEAVATLLTKEGRQAIYRDNNLDKKIRNPDQCFSMNYEPGAIKENALFYYPRKDSRGVDFHIPRGGDHYGVAMVGTANLSDAIQQLYWRMRHLGTAHHAIPAHDPKTKVHILKANHVTEDRLPTIGEAMRYFTLNSIVEEDTKNVKAVIFNSQTPAKTHLDEVVRAPYNENGLGADTQCLEELEGRLFEANRALYIMNSTINWRGEYETSEQGTPVEFVQQLYDTEEKKLFDICSTFDDAFNTLKTQNGELNQILSSDPVKRWLDSADVRKTSDEYMAKVNAKAMLLTKAKQFAKYTADDWKDWESIKEDPFVKYVLSELGEGVFNEKEKVLAGLLDQCISPHHSETWRDWQNAINEGLTRYRQEKPENANATRFEAFMQSHELALQRSQFLRYMMLQTPELCVRIERAIWRDLKYIDWEERTLCKLPYFEKRLAVILNNTSLKKYSPAQLANAREVMRKRHAFQLALQNTYRDIQEGKQCLKKKAYQQTLDNNLPGKINLDADSGAGKEQRVQQKQQQEQKVKPKELRRIEPPRDINIHTEPINFNFFQRVISKDVSLRKCEEVDLKTFSAKAPKYYFENNGHFLPLSIVLEQKKSSIRLQGVFKESYADTYISHRAYSLLKKMGFKGDPCVEILCVEAGGSCHSVIITPTEREQTLAYCMQIKRDPTLLQQPPAVPVYTRESAWNDFKAAFATIKPGYAGALEAKRQHPKIVELFTRFLNAHSQKDAWCLLLTQANTLYNTLGMEVDLAARLKPQMAQQIFSALEQRLRQIYSRYQETRLIDPPLNGIDKVAIYALSNEKFSYLRMDQGADIPQENSNRFIYTMVMNKLFLNWEQFTLPELDLLIGFVDNEKRVRPKGFELFLKQLTHANSSQIAEFLRALSERKKPPKELGKKVELNAWMFEFVQRKLKENYAGAYTQEERRIIKQWLYRLPPGEIDTFERNNLQEKDNSLSIFKRLRERVIQQKIEEDIKQRLTKDAHNINYQTLYGEATLFASGAPPISVL